MRMLKDLPPIDATVQKEPIVFDFQPYLPIGVTLVNTPVVEVEVAENSEVDDASPSTRKIGAPFISTVSPPDGAGVANTAIAQFIGNCQPGVIYLIQMSCDRSDGGIASGWTHMKCNDPK